MRTITFHPSWKCWRQRASEALRAGVSPSDVVWVSEEHDAQTVLPLAAAGGSASGSVRTSPVVPAEGGELLRELEPWGELVVCHARDDRFSLLYRLLWRIQHGESDLLSNMLDPEVFRLRRMAAAVRDDLKQVRSRLRLHDPAWTSRARKRPGNERSLPDLVGWCEPRHRTLPLLAHELVARYPRRSFALLSPAASACWDSRALVFGPGARRADASSADELARRWEDRHLVAA